MNLRSVPLSVVVLFWTFGLQRGFAQDNQQYLALLDSYARGDAIRAVASLLEWSEPRVRAVVRTLDARVARDRARTAIMLHTEAAFNEPADGREPFHVGVARSFLQRVIDDPTNRLSTSANRSARDLGARWHALIGTLYCMRGQPAELEINHGLALDQKNKEVNLVAGTLLEQEVQRAVPNLRGRHERLRENQYRALIEAARIYRLILSSHPDFLEARLRLGRVLHLNGSARDSREQLEQVAVRASDGALLYLAHLFLGAVHEQANRLGEAAGEYSAAYAVAPWQSAVIALIRIEAALGHDDRARALAAEIPPAADPGVTDPWHSYNLCFTGPGLLEGLRAEARQP